MLNFKKSQSKIITFLIKTVTKINIKFLITLISFVFLGNSIYGNFDPLSNQTITIKESLWLFGGLIFNSFSIITNAYAWKLLIKNIGCESNKLNIIKLFISTNIYKYLPGGIWHFVSRYNILRSAFSTEKSVESILLEPLLMLVAAFLFIPFGTLSISSLILCWSSTLVFLPVFREFIITKLTKMKGIIFTNSDHLKASSESKKEKNMSISMCYPYRPLFVETIFIFIRFLGFLCCINAFSIGSLISYGELISSFCLAWIIGLIVPAAPGGVGVFESVILFNLGPQLPEAPLLASLLCYRLVSTISDVSAALIYPVRKILKFKL